MEQKITMHSKIIITCFFFFLLSLSLHAQSKQDSVIVTTNSKNVSTYFVNNQMDLFASLWDDNAVFITIAGLVAKGKDKIVDMHALGKYIIDSSTNMQLQEPVVRFLNKDMAITYSVWSGLVFKVQGKIGHIQSGYLTCVLQREKEGWKIVSATNATNGSYAPNLQFSEYSHDMWKMVGVDDKK